MRLNRIIVALVLCAAATPYAVAEDSPPALTNSLGMQFVWIAPGQFTIGSPADEPGRAANEPQRRVRIMRGYWLGIHEVTQQQFARVMERNPSAFSATGDRRAAVEGIDTANLPVETVAWADAVEFCRRLGALPDEQKHSRNYRLPTEAQWEYACRAGETASWSFGGDPDRLAEFAWFGREAVGQRPYAVGTKRANRWGLYDMHGNVWEWCADIEMADEHTRFIRGGSWFSRAASTRSAARRDDPATVTDPDTGFRVVLDP